eukprot:scaffold104898_cov60-Phaeocystis_antarctica.AAC.4
MERAAEAGVRQAEAEGLTLQPSDNAAGYRNVYKDGRDNRPKPFQAFVRRDGKHVHLGLFTTAEEAALAYARTPEAQAQVVKPKDVPLTAQEAVAQAAAEGLTLEPSSNAAGYKGVRVDGSRYQAQVRRAGKQVNLGSFVTAEEAALAVARTPEAQVQVAKPAPLTAEEAVARAAAGGLTLERSNRTAGYTGVNVVGSRYKAYTARAGGKPVYLGSFVTAEEAALAVARDGARTDPPAAAPRAATAKRAAPPQNPPPAKLNPKARSSSEEPTAAPSPTSASMASVRLEVGQSVEACFGGRSY